MSLSTVPLNRTPSREALHNPLAINEAHSVTFALRVGRVRERRRLVRDRYRQGDDGDPAHPLPHAVHHPVPGGDPPHPRQRPHKPPLVRGALHRLLHLRPGLPRRLHPRPDLAAGGRLPQRRPLRDRLPPLHVLRPLRRGLPPRGDPGTPPPPATTGCPQTERSPRARTRSRCTSACRWSATAPGSPLAKITLNGRE